MEEKVATIKYKLPMSNDYESTQYYIRDCYKDYYPLLESFLRNKTTEYAGNLGGSEQTINQPRYTTLTGTPGIGKSLFYVYFFHRYKEAHSDDTIVTASFNNNRQFVQCKVFDADDPEGREEESIPKIKGAVYLYDGPPVDYPRDVRMICFTSPNDSWIKKTLKDATIQQKVYLPAWTMKEFHEAVVVLDLDFEEDELNDRFNFFGGSARCCLAQGQVYLNSMKKEIRAVTGSIESFQDVYRIFSNPSTGAQVRHLIFYFVSIPGSPFPFEYGLDFGSVKIKELITNSVEKHDEEGRRKFISQLKSEPIAGTMLGWAFEDYCCDMFQNGGKFALKSNTNKCKDILIPENCYKHLGGNTESIDGVCTSENDIYLFQITRDSTHPVNASGLMEHLLEGRSPHLVFVVPKNSKLELDQKILVEQGNDEDSVICIKGIGSVNQNKLRSSGIYTIGQLRDQLEKDEVQGSRKKKLKTDQWDASEIRRRFKTKLEKHLQLISKQDEITKIPQYIIKTEVDY